jgi:hypothetical protein
VTGPDRRSVPGGRVRFRHSQAIWVAALIAFLGALPLATARWFLLPVLLIPLGVGIWAFRAGTDADPTGVRVRALLRQRRIPWPEISELAAGPDGRAVALLADGRATPLPAVRAADLPRLVAASGQPLIGHPAPGEPESEPGADPPDGGQRTEDRQASADADRRPGDRSGAGGAGQ